MTIYIEPVSLQEQPTRLSTLFQDTFTHEMERTMFRVARELSPEACDDFWQPYLLSNGGALMAPARRSPYVVEAGGGSSTVVSSEALGLASCVAARKVLRYARSGRQGAGADQLARLMAFVDQHEEAPGIYRLLD